VLQVVGGMEDGGLEDDVRSLERRRRRRDKCVKAIITTLFSHIGLAAIVVAYTIMGGFVFQALEAPAEGHEKLRIKKFKMDKVEELAQQAMRLRVNLIDRDNFTASAHEVLYQFQQQASFSLPVISFKYTYRARPIHRSRSFKVTDFGTNRKPIWDFLLVINSN